ncbi:MAG: glycoside hydrolase family 3 protein [Candidatus Hodarchaeales archaeon]
MRKFKPLNLYSEWVTNKLNVLTLEEKIGQLLHPSIYPATPPSKIKELLSDVEVGGVFLFTGTVGNFSKTITFLQQHFNTPVIISSDLENGPGRMILGTTVFPDLMSLAATDDETLAYGMGRSSALEGRSYGVHWAFGPIVDVNANPDNPINNTRSLGDNPDKISRLSCAMVQGMQENGLCATIKHFPGDGLDDRDPHICTIVNPLSQDDWFKISGKPFQAAIDLGVWAVMIGHIALPAFETNNETNKPAQVSKALITDLLRNRMGFDGLIITDAIEMAGLTSYKPIEEILVETINAGCDMILFSEVKRDFNILKKAFKENKISIERINDAVRRILSLKEILGLHKDVENKKFEKDELNSFRQLSQTIADKAVTLVKNDKNLIPLNLKKGSKILSYHIRSSPQNNVDSLDELLTKEGYEITRKTELDEKTFPLSDKLNKYEFILINIIFNPTWGLGRIRIGGDFMRKLWFMMNTHRERMIIISFGSPYILYDLPWADSYINAYSPDINTQKSVVDILLGKKQAVGTSPVDIFRAEKMKIYEATIYKELTKSE